MSTFEGGQDEAKEGATDGGWDGPGFILTGAASSRITGLLVVRVSDALDGPGSMLMGASVKDGAVTRTTSLLFSSEELGAWAKTHWKELLEAEQQW